LIAMENGWTLADDLPDLPIISMLILHCSKLLNHPRAHVYIYILYITVLIY
jgi:hypothetical protein